MASVVDDSCRPVHGCFEYFAAAQGTGTPDKKSVHTHAPPVIKSTHKASKQRAARHTKTLDESAATEPTKLNESFSSPVSHIQSDYSFDAYFPNGNFLEIEPIRPTDDGDNIDDTDSEASYSSRSYDKDDDEEACIKDDSLMAAMINVSLDLGNACSSQRNETQAFLRGIGNTCTSKRDETEEAFLHKMGNVCTIQRDEFLHEIGNAPTSPRNESEALLHDNNIDIHSLCAGSLRLDGDQRDRIEWNQSRSPCADDPPLKISMEYDPEDNSGMHQDYKEAYDCCSVEQKHHEKQNHQNGNTYMSEHPAHTCGANAVNLVISQNGAVEGVHMNIAPSLMDLSSDPLMINDDALAKHTTAAIASMFDLDNSLHNLDDDRDEHHSNESSTNDIRKKLDFGLPNNDIYKLDISEISEIDHGSYDDEEDDHNHSNNEVICKKLDFVFSEEPPYHHQGSAQSSMTEDNNKVSKTATISQEELAQCVGGQCINAIPKETSPIEHGSYTKDLVLLSQVHIPKELSSPPRDELQNNVAEFNESSHARVLEGQVDSDSQDESYSSVPDRTIAEDTFESEGDEMAITKNQHPETTVRVKNESQPQAEGSFAVSENGLDASEVFAHAKQTMEKLLDVNPEEETFAVSENGLDDSEVFVDAKQTMGKLLDVNPEEETTQKARASSRLEAKTQLWPTDHQASIVRMKANARARRAGRVKKLVNDDPISTTKDSKSEPRMTQMKVKSLLTRTK